MPDAHSPQAEDTCQHAGRASSPLGRAGITRSRQDLQNGFLDALRRTASLMQLMGQVAADRIGINTTDLNCLNILSFTGSMTAGQLARATGLTTASITGVIDRLEQAGYARRERDPHDRRRVVIHLSPETATGTGRPRPVPHPKTSSRRRSDQRISPGRMTWTRFRHAQPVLAVQQPFKVVPGALGEAHHRLGDALAKGRETHDPLLPEDVIQPLRGGEGPGCWRAPMACSAVLPV